MATKQYSHLVKSIRNFGAQPVLVAHADQAGQLGPHGSDGLARMVVPGDQAGGRYVSDLVSLKVGSLPEPGPTGPGGFSDQFTLSSEIAKPETYLLTPLSHLPIYISPPPKQRPTLPAPAQSPTLIPVCHSGL